MSNTKTIKSYNLYAKKWAEKMRSKKNVAHTYLEKPAMYSKVPNIKGKNVLCIGCGSGEECNYLSSLGARRVVGIDASEELIKEAKQTYPELEFKVMNAEDMRFPIKSFDFIYSSLTMHYIEHWTRVLNAIHKLLKNGGSFLFSTNHPIKWGAEKKRTKRKDEFLLGYTKYKNKDTYLVHGDYLNERKINDIWFEEFPISYYHKSISNMIDVFNISRFQIIDCLEPKPISIAKKIKNNFWNIHQKIPLFIIFHLKKNKT